MTHKRQRRYLIEELLKENRQYSGMKIPTDENEQKDLLRALMNVRLPKAVLPRFLEIQDEYLQEEMSVECLKSHHKATEEAAAVAFRL